MDEKYVAGCEKLMQEWLPYDACRRLARHMGARPNECFDTALQVFLRVLPEVFQQHGGVFVEGWFVIETEDEVVMNEHGWCELAYGTIVDASLPLLVTADQAVSYFPGVMRSWEEVSQLAQRPEAFFPYVRCEGHYGPDGLGHPGYRAAYEAARTKTQRLAATTGKTPVFLTAQEDLGGSSGLTIVILG